MLRPLKCALIGLLAVVFVTPVLAARARMAKAAILPLKLNLPLLPVVFSVPSYPKLDVELNFGAKKPAGAICGGVLSFPMPFRACGGVAFVLPENPSTLGEPLPLLGRAYLKCESIRVSRLEPLVRVADFPGTDFGDWVQNGVLVRTRAELSEPRMRALFLLLAECVDVPQDDYFWLEETADDPDGSRRETQAKVEWAIVFTGEVPLRVSYSPATARLLLESGERWGLYYLDPPRAATLTAFLAAKE